MARNLYPQDRVSRFGISGQEGEDINDLAADTPVYDSLRSLFGGAGRGANGGDLQRVIEADPGGIGAQVNQPPPPWLDTVLDALPENAPGPPAIPADPGIPPGFETPANAAVRTATEDVKALNDAFLNQTEIPGNPFNVPMAPAPDNLRPTTRADLIAQRSDFSPTPEEAAGSSAFEPLGQQEGGMHPLLRFLLERMTNWRVR